MIKFIKKLLGICDHNWETEASIKIFDDYNTSWCDSNYSHTEKHCQCSKCGVWKKFKV